MTDDLAFALRRLLKNVVREAAADLTDEWKTPARHQAPESTPADDGFLLTPRETAKRLAISERHLFQLTRSGQLPCVRVGKCVRYNVETIQQWVRDAESTAQPSATKTHASKQASATPKSEATRSPRLKPKNAASQTQRGPAREKAPEPQKKRSPKTTPPVSTGRPQEVQGEERISPLSVLLSNIGIDRSKLRPITNGDLRRIAEVDIATMHGWLYLKKSLPEVATKKLKNHFLCLFK